MALGSGSKAKYTKNKSRTKAKGEHIKSRSELRSEEMVVFTGPFIAAALVKLQSPPEAGTIQFCG